MKFKKGEFKSFKPRKYSRKKEHLRNKHMKMEGHPYNEVCKNCGKTMGGHYGMACDWKTS